ncbi:metallophosphoesterase [Persicobacter psychrovividus]|uniref:Phosphoesterase n=1 Tax=Persicobacter psychrovividus TaxID=387638 RepID=A0ABN6LB96_9BACT|nr:phosphoesterase [Persicobacter psychrovividus]
MISFEKIVPVFIFLLIMLLLDVYIFQAVKLLVGNLSSRTIKYVYNIYWGVAIFCLLLTLALGLSGPASPLLAHRQLILTVLTITYFSKMIGSMFLVLDDIVRGVRWMADFLSSKSVSETVTTESLAEERSAKGVSRGEFLSKASLVGVAVPMATMSFGIISGAHDYRIRRRTVYLPNLPQAFDGIQVAQLSDIHTGSFFNKTAVKGGVEMLMKEKPDVVFFTGDLVNNVAEEARDYVPIFKEVKADLGVFSVMGNHDYGDYQRWTSANAKNRNFQDFKEVHKTMGWDLMLDENRLITVDGADLGVIGVQNWGTGRFAKYGQLDKAYQGMEHVATKILLSHDPSHWDAQVRPEYGDIDLTLSGHTHGFQCGIEIGDFRWSPAQWRYKQWADLYQEGRQYLYVNRGFGYIGYPGRIGILPEITILELKKAIS